MKSKKAMIVALMLLSSNLVLVSTSAISLFKTAVTAGSGSLPKFVVEPEHAYVPYSGEAFNASVWLDVSGASVTNLKGWQVVLEWNTTVLDCIGASLLPGHPFEGLQLMNPLPSIDHVTGTASFMCITLLMSDYVNVTSNKPLFNFAFKGVGTGVSVLTFLKINETGGTYLIDNTGAKVDADAVQGDVTVGFPQFVVEPTHTYISSIGETFSVDIQLDVSKGNITNLKGWQIKLNWNANVVNCSGASLLPGHPFEGIGYQSPPPYINHTTGTLAILCITTLMSDYVNLTSDRPLCRITFNSVAEGFSDIAFFNVNKTRGTYLINKAGLKIYAEGVSGDVTVGGTIPEYSKLVTDSYVDMLFRDADQAGLNFWIGELQSGRLTKPGFVLEAMFESTEYRRKWAHRLFVALMYTDVFERVPDQEGYDVYVAALDSKTITWEQMLDIWLSSPEWNERFGMLTDAEFVTKLYHGMLHREPEPEGLNYHTGVLEDDVLTRAQLILVFYHCPEYQTASVEEKLVHQLYLGLLRRVPETEGYAYWVNELQVGATKENVTDAFLGSSEYIQGHV